MAIHLTTIDPLQEILQRSPLGIISDIDGTIAPIAPTPEEADVSPRCRDILLALMETGVCVAFNTGRSLDVARSMIDLTGATFAANHGLEFWIDGRRETPASLSEYVSEARKILAELTELQLPGVLVEDKGPIIALHYRLAENEEQARATLLRAARELPAARGFRVQEGKKVIELRPPLQISKGSAVAEIVQRLDLEAAVCIGDDVSDFDMFEAGKWLREGGMPVVNIAVRSSEAIADVLDSADYFLDGVDGVEWFLEEVLKLRRSLHGTQP